MSTAAPPALRGLSRAIVEAIVREVVTERLGRSVPVSRSPTLAVHASARHIHLCREHLDQLAFLLKEWPFVGSRHFLKVTDLDRPNWLA